MKNAVFGIVMAIILAIVIITTALVHSRAERTSEIRSDIEHALQTSMEKVLEKEYEAGDEKLVEKDITTNILLEINSDSDVKVKFNNIDLKKGIISVSATAIYDATPFYPIRIGVNRTMILEKDQSLAYSVHYTKLDGTEFTASISSNHLIILPDTTGSWQTKDGTIVPEGSYIENYIGYVENYVLYLEEAVWHRTQNALIYDT